MRSSIPLFFGIFVVMALSNAIVPVLPLYATGSALQGAVYSAYFLGALVITLPAGVLSDRYGRIPLIRSGLFLTFVSGIFLLVSTQPEVVIVSRFVEGVGGGCFVATAMAYVNSRDSHRKDSGILMAMMNAGLVSGLVLSGWLAVFFQNPSSGIMVFTAVSLIPAGLVWLDFRTEPTASQRSNTRIIPSVFDHIPIWYSSIVLIGITGVVASLYPQFSGMPPDLAGVWIAAMSVSTVAAVLLASRVPWHPVRVIRWSALFMSVGVGIAYFSPTGFIVLGFLAGLVMISLMEILSGQKEKQGILMGLFSTSSYFGMAVLPFSAGLIVDLFGFGWAFILTAILSVSVIVASLSIRSGTGVTATSKKQ